MTTTKTKIFAIAALLTWPLAAPVTAADHDEIFGATEIVSSANPETTISKIKQAGLLKALSGNVSLAVASILLHDNEERLTNAINETTDGPRVVTVPLKHRGAPTAVDAHTVDDPFAGVDLGDRPDRPSLASMSKTRVHVASGIVAETATVHARVRGASAACWNGLLSTTPNLSAEDIKIDIELTSDGKANFAAATPSPTTERLIECLNERLAGENAPMLAAGERFETALKFKAPD